MAHVQGGDCFCLRYSLSDEPWRIKLTQKTTEMDFCVVFCALSNQVKFSLWSIIETFPRGCMTFQGRCAPFFHSLRCRKGAHVEAKFPFYTQQNPIKTHTNTTTLFRFAIQLRSSSLFTKGAVYKYDISMTLGGILDLFKKILLLSVSWQSILTMGM